ncbi:formimidoylglutamase [Schinkia azotoformans LMG 9581]|uniref:Formimidoylglutamase n=2 Tax=Schinkia azotoformans TaxID=1454 RepID=K6DYY0_SCHAZ|nr:formimidoylglutamase [Schinkia azotoformans LMG 9581]
MEMVKGGMDATIVPKSVLDVYGNKSLYSTPIRDANMISSLGIVWLEHHFLTTPAKNFIKLVTEISHLLNKNIFPIILGGGHETFFGHYLGVRHHIGSEARLGIINMDAHFDMRPYDSGIFTE